MSRTGLLRTSRKYHRWIGSAFFLFFFVISITGFLLGWKSLFNTTIYEGPKETASSTGKWLPLESIEAIAEQALAQKAGVTKLAKIDRLDIRPSSGAAAIQFHDNYVVTVNMASGNVHQIEKKSSSIILRIHEGSIVDDWMGTGFFKKTYVTVLGVAFFLLTLTGFWLWYKTRMIKKKNAVNKRAIEA